MTISKALLPTAMCALDFKANLEALDIPARLIKNASGNPSRYVVFDSTNLTQGQLTNLDSVHNPMYVRIDIHDVLFEEEVKNG